MQHHLEIDLLKLYAQSDNKKWNHMLTECLRDNDINRLVKIRYGIQMGMSSLAKKKMNDEKICAWFIRLDKSIYDTARAIIRKVNPLPNDDPSLNSMDTIHIKRKRDRDLEKFLKDSSF